jgi:hypothetical protein
MQRAAVTVEDAIESYRRAEAHGGPIPPSRAQANVQRGQTNGPDEKVRDLGRQRRSSLSRRRRPGPAGRCARGLHPVPRSDDVGPDPGNERFRNRTQPAHGTTLVIAMRK